ncbi:hypothetical protein Tco_0867929, partial [Tanacetum coccineum]
LFSPPNLDLSYSGLEEFQQPEFEGYGPKPSKSVSEDTSNEVSESPEASLIKELVSDDKLEKKTVFPTIAKIEFVRPKQQEKPVRKPVKYAEMYRLTAITIKGKGCNHSHRIYLEMGEGMGRHPLAVPGFCLGGKNGVWGHPPKEDQGYVDSGCSRHMTGNMSYLSDFKEFDEGYVTFGGGSKGGKITSKGTLKTGKLDFEDVYVVKELQFNISSISQMCDKKNSVLFTNIGCFVLYPDFKLTDESQVLLKVPRKNNMYTIDMKNIVPKESLTCLVAKATLDESMLWHKRLVLLLVYFNPASYHGFVNIAANGIDVYATCVWFLVKRRISRQQHVLIDKETTVEILVLLDLRGRISAAGYEVSNASFILSTAYEYLVLFFIH